MVESAPFREPVVREETIKEPQPDTVTSKESVHVTGESTMPPNLFREAGKTPYLMSLIDSGEFAYKTFNVKELADRVDVFIDANTKEEYERKFSEIMEQAKIESDDVYIIVDKLSEFVRIQQKLLDTLKEKEEFEAKDPSEMNSKELRRYLNG